ncbi:MAG: MAPEG family protein [Gammaproteobacteria bacterium]|nr:MAPEG family protein [Gammaproteobacteria bacterium]
MTIAVVCVAVLGLLLFGLGLNVSLTRRKTQTGIGFNANDGADPLTKAVRAHGNTAEFAALLAVLMLYLGSTEPAAWVVWTMIITTACRVLIVVGIFASPTLDKAHPLRFAGAAGTYFGGLLLSIAALLTVL